MPGSPPQETLTAVAAPVLVLGGAYSGKSELAMQMLAPDRPAIVLGTAPAAESAFAKRLRSLKAMRPGPWQSRDAGLDLAAAVDEAAGTCEQILIDSVSQWLASLVVYTDSNDETGEHDLAVRLADRLAELARVLTAHPKARIVVVSAEVGGGPAPARPAERLYRQAVGAANLQLATWARSVVVVHAGLPLKIK